ncbi:MAG: FecCD family ABC transporter permease [Bradymonadaceae bacterium]
MSLVAMVAVGLLGLSYGSSDVGGLATAWRLLAGTLGPAARTIVVEIRLPRVFFASLVGAALAAGGAVFQAVLRNPLADPYILGISGGAALGGTLLMSLGGGLVGVAGLGTLGAWIGAITPTVAAFVGALGTLAIIYGVDRWSPAGRTTTYVLLLTGVIVNAFASSVIMFLQSVVSARKAQELLFYLMGSLSVEGTPTATMVVVGVGITAAVAALMAFARDLNALSLGDEEAASLGVDVERTRWWTVGIASLAVAFAVAYTGLIGFVGLVVPHGVRLVTGPDHRVLIPCCAFVGAAFLTFADLLTRVAFPVFSTALPVGVVTAFIGAPLFLFFLWRNLGGRG